MIKLITILILKIFSILPDSPFSGFFADMDTGFLEYLNWFLPLDVCLNMMIAWVDCVLFVFIVLVIKKYIIDAAIQFITSLASFFKFLV